MRILSDPVDESGKEFYVTVIDGERYGFLLGPYPSHAEAKSNVDRGRAEACKANSRAHFYGFGTASLPTGTSRQTVFGN